MLSEHKYDTSEQKAHQASSLTWSVHRRPSSPRRATWRSERFALSVFCRQNSACADSRSSSTRTESLSQGDKCPREPPPPRTVESGSSLGWPEGVEMSARVKHAWIRPAVIRANAARSARLSGALSPQSSPVARWTSVRGRMTNRPWSRDDPRHSVLSEDPSLLSGNKSLSGSRARDTRTSLSLEKK